MHLRIMQLHESAFAHSCAVAPEEHEWRRIVSAGGAGAIAAPH